MKKYRVIWPVILFVCVASITAFLAFGPASRAQNDKEASPEKFRDIVESDAKIGPIENPDISVLDATELGIWNGKGIEEQPIAYGAPIGADLGDEVEPNGTSATATTLSGAEGRIKGLVYPNGDVDFYSITVPSNARVYAAVMTSWSASASVDSFMDLIGTDGTTVLESDNDDGSFGSTSSSIAGAPISSAGTYYLRVRHNSATGQLRPYWLYFAIRTGIPVAEVEPNNDTTAAMPLGSNREVSGSTSTTVDDDLFSLSLNAGDTVFLSLNMDPERDNVQWNGRLGLALFGSGTPNQILVVNDASAGSAANPLSEAFFFTVSNAGTYFVFADEPAGASGGSYTLNVSIIPAKTHPDCTTYTSTDVPQAIPTGPGIVSSNLTVPGGSRRILSAHLFIDLTHTFMQDLDVHLVSPKANDNGVFTDIGAATVGGTQTGMKMWFDDFAGIPPLFAVTEAYRSLPELNYRMEWFKGMDPTGTWRLDIRDDATGDGGTLNGWSLRICEEPDLGPRNTVYSQDFESNDGGYTHSGTQDEWEYGTPATAAASGVASFLDCNSGTKCWKTDLDSTYNASSTQDLVSPSIAIPGGSTNVHLEWAMRYHMESASFDHAWVEVFETANPSNIKRVWEWDGATMNNSVGSPSVSIGESAGWGIHRADISSFAGTSVTVRFHLDSDSSVQLAGLAVDDVKITRQAVPAIPTEVTVRLQTASGRGITNSFVILEEQNGTDHVAWSNSFGYARFFSILTQQQVTVTPVSKRYDFTPQTFFLSGPAFVSMTGTPSP